MSRTQYFGRMCLMQDLHVPIWACLRDAWKQVVHVMMANYRPVGAAYLRVLTACVCEGWRSRQDLLAVGLAVLRWCV